MAKKHLFYEIFCKKNANGIIFFICNKLRFTHDNFIKKMVKCLWQRAITQQHFVVTFNYASKNFGIFPHGIPMNDENNSQINLNAWACTVHRTQCESMLRQLKIFFFSRYRKIDVKVSILPFFVDYSFNYWFMKPTMCVFMKIAFICGLLWFSADQ